MLLVAVGVSAVAIPLWTRSTSLSTAPFRFSILHLLRIISARGCKRRDQHGCSHAFKLANAVPLVQELGITALHIKLCGTGGNKNKTLGPDSRSALRALITRLGMKIGHIDTQCGDANMQEAIVISPKLGLKVMECKYAVG
ncbi:unnamed protein product [Urochloa humidicola]